MKAIKSEFKIKQSEYFQAIDRAKNRMDNKNTFFVKQLEDEISELKRKQKFWSKKYFNLKKENKKCK